MPSIVSHHRDLTSPSSLPLQVWTPLPPPVSLQALSSPDDICAYSLPLGDSDLPYALSKKFMSQVNCVKHSVKKLQYVPPLRFPH